MALDEEKRTRLHRARRFLVLMCLALIGYNVMGASVSTQMEYGGFGIRLVRPERVEYGLWFVCIWAVWRYAQAVIELFADVKRDVLEDVRAEDTRIAGAWATREAQKLADKGELDDSKRPNVHILGVGFRPVDDRGSIFKASTRGRRYEGVQGQYSWHNEGDDQLSHSTFQHVVMERTRAESAWHRVRAWVWALVKLPAISEQFMPILIVAASIASFWFRPMAPMCGPT